MDLLSHAAPTPENNFFTEMCSGSEAGSYTRSIGFMHHSTPGLRLIKKKKQNQKLRGLMCVVSMGVHTWRLF